MQPYDAVLDALGDRTRRAVLDRLRAGPLPVVEIARDLPVSRPAVSQHLKVLKDAGLVASWRAGTRRIYALRLEGLDLLRAYSETFPRACNAPSGPPTLTLPLQGGGQRFGSS